VKLPGCLGMPAGVLAIHVRVSRVIRSQLTSCHVNEMHPGSMWIGDGELMACAVSVDQYGCFRFIISSAHWLIHVFCHLLSVPPVHFLFSDSYEMLPRQSGM